MNNLTTQNPTSPVFLEVGRPDNPEANVDFPILGWTRLSSLIPSRYNRQRTVKHINTMEGTIREYGFADVIKVFAITSTEDVFAGFTPEDIEEFRSKGLDTSIAIKYTIAESAHRVESLRILHPTTDPLVPIAVIDWISVNDVEEVQKLIISLNVTGKTWTIFDYVKSHAEMTNRSNVKLFREIRDNMKLLTSSKITGTVLTNGLVAGIYSKMIMGHDPLRNGNLTISKTDRKYLDKLLQRIPSWCTSTGTKKISNQFLRRLIYFMWNVQSIIVNKHNKLDFKKWSTFLDRVLIQAGAGLKVSPLPDGDDTFYKWWLEVCQELGIDWDTSVGMYKKQKLQIVS